MKRSYFLKAACFLMMISSLTRFIFGLGMLNLYSILLTRGEIPKAVMTLAVVTLIVHIGCALCELVGGFTGALNWEEPLLSHKCIRWGIAALALGLIGNLLQVRINYEVSYVAWTTGAVIPGLYLIASLIFWYFGKVKYKDVHNLGIK